MAFDRQFHFWSVNEKSILTNCKHLPDDKWQMIVGKWQMKNENLQISYNWSTIINNKGKLQNDELQKTTNGCLKMSKPSKFLQGLWIIFTNICMKTQLNNAYAHIWTE